MRKCLLPYLIIIAFLFGCAAFKIPVQKVEGNTFYCSSPRLEVEVSKELKFVGEKKQRNNKAPGYFKYFLFRGTSNQLAISVAKARSEWTFSNPSVGRRCGDNLYCGKLRLGGHNYQYTTSTEGPYLKRTYFRNTHNNTAKIVIMIWGKRDTELASEREQLILFDKNCKAAFTIKAEKVASSSKPDSSLSNNSFDRIVGQWWMEGEVMVIEEIDNRLSIRMDRLRGYHLGPSGQAKYRETTHSNNISWDGKHLEFEIWMPSGAGGYEVFYSLTLSDPNTLLGTKQASGSSLKIEVEFKER
jgi:hypothetical protein